MRTSKSIFVVRISLIHRGISGLLEIIPTPYTDPSVVDFLMHYGDLYLGKTTVLCKDTPAFIANRIGVLAFCLFFTLWKSLAWA